MFDFDIISFWGEYFYSYSIAPEIETQTYASFGVWSFNIELLNFFFHFYVFLKIIFLLEVN